MTEKEKKAIKDLKNIVTDLEDAESGAIISLQQNEIDSLKIIAELIDKQQEEIEELNEKISKAIGHIESCKTTLGNYILTPNETECLLNILREEKR